MSKSKAIIMKPIDNVATATEDITPGEKVILNVDGIQVTVNIKEKIPFGHKFAVKEIKKGEKIVKYGEVIGVSTTDIAVGYHTHVHNLEGVRGRGDLAT